jgi:tetratricopeptide (TPR) repeat protein
MAMLVTVLKGSYGAAYNPAIVAASHSGQVVPMDNARDVFLNGLLDEDRKRRHGTCASIPVLVASIGRRLGYPIRLAVAGRHIFARWDGEGLRFNIEATGPMGMTISSDEKYLDDHVSPERRGSPYFVRNLTPIEEFGLFLTFRVECLVYAERHDETLRYSARAMQFAPDDPCLHHWACIGLNTAMRRRYNRANPTIKLPPVDAPGGLDFNVGPLLDESERASYLTIIAHLDERDGRLHDARERYENACRENFHGLNEQRDLQRFLKKYNLPKKGRPLMPPQLLRRRNFKLNCQPHEEASILRQMANNFYRNGEFLRSRKALQDLYMFDPGDAEVFQGTRKLTAMPEFQEQLKADIADFRKRQQQI